MPATKKVVKKAVKKVTKKAVAKTAAKKVTKKAVAKKPVAKKVTKKAIAKKVVKKATVKAKPFIPVGTMIDGTYTPKAYKVVASSPRAAIGVRNLGGCQRRIRFVPAPGATGFAFPGTWKQPSHWNNRYSIVVTSSQFDAAMKVAKSNL